MDAQQLRKALYDFFKFNPRDFFVKGSLTGFNVELANSNVAQKPDEYLPPWGCYVKEYDASTEYITLGVNPISRLMKQQGYRADYSDLRWTDAVDPGDIINFPDAAGAGFTLTNPSEVVWLEGHFNSAGQLDYTTLEIKHGARWGSSLAYQTTTGSYFGSLVAFDTRILLAYFEQSSLYNTAKDYLHSGIYYTLMRPVTTHLAEGFVRGRYDNPPGTPTIEDFPAIIPWHGSVFDGS